MRRVNQAGLEGYVPVRCEDGTWAVGQVMSRRVNARWGYCGPRKPVPGVYAGPGARERIIFHDESDGGFCFEEAQRIAKRLTKRLHLGNRARRYSRKAMTALAVSEQALVKMQQNGENVSEALKLQREAHFKTLQSAGPYSFLF